MSVLELTIHIYEIRNKGALECVIDNVMLKELKYCVSEHLKLLKQLFDAKLIPKHHFMLHYANIIRMVGPLIHMSMFRFDAKHTQLKKVVRNTNNFRNMNKTIAIKHQQSLACHESSFCEEQLQWAYFVSYTELYGFI